MAMFSNNQQAIGPGWLCPFPCTGKHRDSYSGTQSVQMHIHNNGNTINVHLRKYPSVNTGTFKRMLFSPAFFS